MTTSIVAAPQAPPTRLRRVGLVSVHTSPLDQPGTGDGGGLNVYVGEVARGLAGRGIHVDVLTRRTDPDVPRVVPIQVGVDVVHIDAGPPRPVPKEDVANLLCAFVLGMERQVDPAAYDVLHAHYWLSGWVARRLARRHRVPFVHTFHTIGVLKNANLAPGDRPEPPLRLVAEERIARDADRLLVLTCGEARLLHRTSGVSGRRLTVARPGVDLGRFGPAVGRRGNDGPSRLLFVGRLQPLKGPDVAIRTLAEVRRTEPDTTLTIVGGASGPDGARQEPGELRRLASRLGVADAVTFAPVRPQEQLVEYYRQADVLLVPSRSETFGLVALEAQACGLPVVAARVPGLEAVVGDGGTLVDGHDPRDHARAVVDFLRDPAKAAAAADAGRATAARHTWSATVDRLVTAYREVVAAPRRADEIARRSKAGRRRSGEVTGRSVSTADEAIAV